MGREESNQTKNKQDWSIFVNSLLLLRKLVELSINFKHKNFPVEYGYYY